MRTNRRMSHLQLQADSCNTDTARRVKPPLLETADFNDARNPPVRSAPPPVPFRPRCVAVMRPQARPVRIRSLRQRPSGRREATAENRSGSSADHLRRPVSDASGSVCRQTHPTRPTVASQGTGHDVNRQRQPVREIGGNLKWHEVIGDPTLANAILDRLVHNAYKLDLKGDSMRKRSRPSTRTENRDS